MRKLFAQELLKELKEAKPNKIDIKEVLWLIEDILRFFEKDNTNEYKMNPWMLGMQEIFHSFITRVWVGINFGSDICRKFGKIVTQKII